MGQIFRMHFAGDEAAAERRETKSARLFTDETDDFEGRAHGYFVFSYGSNRFERAEHTDGTVVFAAVNDRVEMRAGQNRGRLRITALQPAKDVTYAVDMYLKLRLAHQVNQHLTASQFFDRENQARHPTAVADADAADGV